MAQPLAALVALVVAVALAAPRMVTVALAAPGMLAVMEAMAVSE